MTRSTDDEERAEQIRSAGWRQGAVIRAADFERLRGHVEGQKALDTDDSDWWIVLSHDCDVVSRDLNKEPWIEVLVARLHKGRKADSRLTQGRNPRRLHFDAQDGERSVILDASVHERFRLPRELLADISPESDRSLATASCRLLSQWIAKRYIRSAFPDSFNRRLGSQRREFEKFYEENADLLSSVYIAVTPEDELGDGRDYRCAATLVHPTNITDWERIEKMRDDFAGILRACSGIEIAGIRSLSEGEFTLDDLRVLKRLDLDFLSDSEDDPLPPSGADIQ